MTPGSFFASSRGLLVHLLLIGLVVGGCTCDDTDRTGDGAVDVDANTDLDAATDADTDGGGSQGTCSPIGDLCGAGCCLGLSCDVGTGRCSLPSIICAGTGDDCTDGNDCCSLYCDGTSKCGAACVQNTQGCSSDGECCSGNCNASNVCANTSTNPGTCASTGNACTVDANCCSGNCVGNVCASTGAACAPIGDRCYGDTDCCSFKCNLSDASSPAGFCESFGTAPCAVAGEPCDGTSCADCCSRACAPTASGATVCSNLSGCRVNGDICETDSDCCGASTSGLPSASDSTCLKDPGATFGRCKVNHGPDGEICSLVTPLCGGVSMGSSNCDCEVMPKSECCHIDSAGSPRCSSVDNATCPNGIDGSPNCCIAAGQACATSASCCNDTPCLQTPGGGYVCGDSCSGDGETCANTGDCCLGLTCVLPAGQITGTCMMPPTPTDPDAGVPDGGSTDAGTPPLCAGYSQTCTMNSDCCPGMLLSCFDYVANTACTGGTNCACLQVLE